MTTEGDEGELDEGPDPFEGLTLDDDFIRSASVVEESAEERLARLAAIDAEHKRLAAEREVRQPGARQDPAPQRAESVAGPPGATLSASASSSS